MTPAEFKRWQRRLNLSDWAAACALGVKNERTIRRWKNGDIPVSGPASRLCRMIEEALKTYRAVVAEKGRPSGVRLAKPTNPEALKATEAVAAILRRAGVPVEIVEVEGEGEGTAGRAAEAAFKK